MSRRPRHHHPETDAEAPLRPVVLDASLPPDEPLRPDEVRAMKRHLRFLQRHRKTLGLRVNAEEDLLLNGAREPEHRGVALALLSKVDHPLMTKALERVDDPALRTELLGGAARFSEDLGILLLYLESLADSTARSKAAGAFSLAVARMDLGAASPARVQRLLQLLATIFSGHERAQALFGLLHAPGFADVFEVVRDELPADLKAAIVPVTAVYEEIVLGEDSRHGGTALRDGCALLLSAPAEVLAAYPTEVRERLLESAVALVPDDKTADRAASALLASLPSDSEAFARLTLLRAGELLRRGEDERARWLLKRLEGQRSDVPAAALWRDALDGVRVGRFALGWPRPDGKALEGVEAARARRGLQEAFALDAQLPVWLRTAPANKKESFARELALQRRLVLPGVAPVFGAESSGPVLCLAVPAWGRPAPEVVPRLRTARNDALAFALDGVGILGGLAHAGVRLPDARAWRFLALASTSPPRLLLADLEGATEGAPADVMRAHGGLGAGLARDLLGGHESELPPPLRRLLLQRRPPLAALLAALAEALPRLA